MNISFKFKISLWYSALFTLVIVSTLYISYRIISYQIKTEITDNLKTQSALVIKTINDLDEEHNDRESHEHSHSKREKKQNKYRLSLKNLKILTEDTDSNTFLSVSSDKNHIYISPEFVSLKKHLILRDITEVYPKDFNINGVDFSIIKVKYNNLAILIGHRLTSLNNIQRKLLNIFFYIFPVSIILSLICGYFVTQKTMLVIKKINNTITEISSKNLSKRIENPRSKDEVSSLIFTLNSMIDRLEKSFTQAKQFSQDAAHEIRTPLTIMRGEIEGIIENESGNNHTIKTLENILEEVQYLSSISENLLLINNLDTNNIQYHFENINLSRLLTEMLQDIQILSVTKNIKVTSSIKEGISIMGSRELLNRLIWNLADNAVKYNIENGEILINLTSSDSIVKFTIENTGIGVPKSELSNIFNRFYRVDKSRSRIMGGSGLGLSICKWITELHNGTIHAESNGSNGTKIVMTFYV